MTLTREALQAHTNYSGHLKAAADELSVTQAQLAKAIGKDQKTVSRYITGETYPESCIAEIEEYLLSRCCIKDSSFFHINSEKFDEIFSAIYDLLQDNGIHEPTLAKKIGISQKTLNNYHNFRFKTGQPIKLSTETQYKIVKAFIDYGEELFDDDNAEYDAIMKDLRYYRSFNRTSSVRESWTRLIDSLKTWGYNFFVYAADKFELICFYLCKLIFFLNNIESCIFEEYNLQGSCPLYIPPLNIASIEFLREFQKEKSEFIDTEISKDGIEGLTGGYCTDFLFEDTERYIKIYDTFSEQEKKETTALLHSVFRQKKKHLSELQETLQNIYCDFGAPYSGDFDSTEEKITDEEANSLTELFAKQPAEWQRIIINNFDAFFGRLYTDIKDVIMDMRCWLSKITSDNRLKFVSAFEDDILKGFWKSSISSDIANCEYLYTVYSQYMALMAWSSVKNVRMCIDAPSEGNVKIFRKKVKSLHKNEDSMLTMKTRLGFSPLDWYANMLIDIAYLKGMNLFEILFDEIGMFYEMDEYLEYKRKMG